ncbi:MAG: 3-phosphoshikimate 1-carboxyvinyltransferase [Porphyromonadaceae bacterium]|nr:MAG: 3-phosphoshikimate 1-carboxyvinyltransferase [Porphyromonadaceae bacterium]
MQITVQRSKVSGEVVAPPSKSYAQRALAGALLTRGTTIIRNPSRSDDAKAAMGIIRQLGASVDDLGDHLVIKGGFNPIGQKLDCGEAGLSLRMFSPIAALADQTMLMNGTGSLLKRPVQMITDSLNQLGCRCQSQDGFLPVWIKGPLKSGKATIDGSVSSQLLTGMLMALPVIKGDSEITVNNLQSLPYIDLTINILKQFGISVSHHQYETFCIPGKQKYRLATITVEGDWSGAAFLLVAGALAGGVTVSGLQADSLQADRQILKALGYAGARVEIGENCVTVSRDELRAFDFDATHCPDLFPPLVALAAHCNGVSRIEGVGRLIHKESNRAKVLQEEFYKLGISIRVENGNLYVTGPSLMKTGEVDSHGDHRIAMAAATVAMIARTPVQITGAECVAKSYPGFYQDIKSLGGRIDE